MGNRYEIPGRLIVIATPATLPAAERQLRDAGVGALGAVMLNAADASSLGSGAPMPVLGTVEDLKRIRANYPFDTALVSVPAAFSGAIARVRSMLQDMGVAERFLPTIRDVLTHSPSAFFRGVGEIDYASLIGRAPRRMDPAIVGRMLRGKRVLITGAGGSIGSEIARLCASFEPSALQLMERSDNALFEIDRQIGASFPSLRRHAVLHDVVDAEATLRRLVSLRPDVVFHAAAHKHVPLMEDHPGAAVNNNLFGTKSVADAALAVGAERFVLISTDKAVNPTSVMGATKRLAELYVRSLNSPSTPGVTGRTRFSLVRFGNVLGSACSVLPIWSRQIAGGGPITVTHPDMTRFFMTIPEAAALVIQAGAVGGDGITGADAPDVFVLDMGEPVRILDLARRFVEAHGLTPVLQAEPSRSGERGQPGERRSSGEANSILMTITGARPGEKLFEELAYDAEELVKTCVEGVCAWRGSDLDRAAIARALRELAPLVGSHDRHAVLSALHRHVPELDQTRSYNLAESPEQGTQPAAA